MAESSILRQSEHRQTGREILHQMIPAKESEKQWIKLEFITQDGKMHQFRKYHLIEKVIYDGHNIEILPIIPSR